MAEGGWDVPIEDSDFLGINTVAPEEQPRLHTERLVSSRHVRESERKISFPERGFRHQQQQQQPPGLQLVRAAAAVDPFGEVEEDDEREEEWMLDVDQEELVQARNPHPVAPVAGFADRHQLDDGTVWEQIAMKKYICFVVWWLLQIIRTRYGRLYI